MQDILVYTIVAGAAAFVGYRLYRSVSKKGCDKGCNGNCQH